MQSGWAQVAGLAATLRRHSAALLLGPSAGGCVCTGQIAGLVDSRHATVAFESTEGAPPAVFHRFIGRLSQEAIAREIATVPTSQADYRLRGYLAADTSEAATSIAWVLDVYDPKERQGIGHGWSAADDQVLAHIAAAAIQQFATFAAASGAARATPPRSAGYGWFDDSALEAAGIFRILRRESSRPQIVAHASNPPSTEEVPLPRGRGAPTDRAESASFAFAPERQ